MGSPAIAVVVVVGTRPELIKTAPVVHELAHRKVQFAIVHTGQHYTPTLDEVFFRELDLPPPVVNLGVGSLSAAHQLARIVAGTADVLAPMQPRIVLVQGDTNSVLGGTLAAFKLGLAVAHLEAGLRSDDWTMPEEGNRVLAGRMASLHFCPTELQAARLATEGIVRGVYVVGNTIVEASLAFANRARNRSGMFETLGLQGRRYALVTVHRPSNVEDPGRLSMLLSSLADIARARGLALVFPMHPRTVHRIQAFNLAGLLTDPLIPCQPVGYLDMLRLLESAVLVFTDSGGVQEEACTLRVPCVTLRANTERPETVNVGANILCGDFSPEALGSAIDNVISRPRNWPNPFGDGKTAARVVDVLLDPTARLVPSGAPQ